MSQVADSPFFRPQDISQWAYSELTKFEENGELLLVLGRAIRSYEGVVYDSVRRQHPRLWEFLQSNGVRTSQDLEAWRRKFVDVASDRIRTAVPYKAVLIKGVTSDNDETRADALAALKACAGEPNTVRQVVEAYQHVAERNRAALLAGLKVVAQKSFLFKGDDPMKWKKWYEGWARKQ